MTLRPVDLTIIDNETGDPLPNIQVYQLFETDIYGGCWSFLMAMCPTDSSVWLNSDVSDELGRVRFPEKTYDFTCDEYPQAEYLVINLDLIPEFYKKHETTKAKALHFFGLTPLNDFNKTVMTINPRYRGRVIYGMSYAIDDPLDMWQGDQGIFDVEVNLEGYSKPQQTIIVKLKRAVSP
ncbi:MAG: hypothetical protein WBB19_16420 [Desulforhopalus sp.]